MLLANHAESTFSKCYFINKTFKHFLLCLKDELFDFIILFSSLYFKDVNEPPTDLILTNSFVRENKNNSIVGVIKVVDPDVNQRHDCRIFRNSAQNESLFHIDASTSPPILKTAKPLDFESSPYHYIDIVCKDDVGKKNQEIHEKEKQFKIDVIGKEMFVFMLEMTSNSLKNGVIPHKRH